MRPNATRPRPSRPEYANDLSSLLETRPGDLHADDEHPEVGRDTGGEQQQPARDAAPGQDADPGEAQGGREIEDQPGLPVGLDRGAIDRSTRLRDLDVDSLTLVAVLARIEASCGAEFTADDTLALFDARDVGAIIRAVEGRVPGAAARDP